MLSSPSRAGFRVSDQLSRSKRHPTERGNPPAKNELDVLRRPVARILVARQHPNVQALRLRIEKDGRALLAILIQTPRRFGQRRTRSSLAISSRRSGCAARRASGGAQHFDQSPRITLRVSPTAVAAVLPRVAGESRSTVVHRRERLHALSGGESVRRPANRLRQRQCRCAVRPPDAITMLSSAECSDGRRVNVTSGLYQTGSRAAGCQ